MAGVLKPRAATILIGSIRKKYPDLPIHVHTHDSAGTGVASMIACAQAGADAVDAATDSLSGMTSQPSIGALVASLEGGDLDTGLDPHMLRAIDTYWAQVRLLYSPFEAGLTGPDPGTSFLPCLFCISPNCLRSSPTAPVLSHCNSSYDGCLLPDCSSPGCHDFGSLPPWLHADTSYTSQSHDCTRWYTTKPPSGPSGYAGQPSSSLPTQ